MAGRGTLTGALAMAAMLALAGCDGGFSLFNSDEADAETSTSTTTSTRLVERDVEAPQVFSATEPGLWDGRPSLGGVWVAYPGVKDPERVIIRNPANDKFVIGALFRREREMPGPKLQVSSDAAAALDLLAGQPARLEVVALRREEAVETPPPPAEPVLDAAETIATEALETIESAEPVTPTAAPPTPTPKPAPAASGGRNLVQIGIFSVEENASRAVKQLAGTGVTATVKKESSQGKTFWRVVAGPAAEGRDALLTKVKAAGFADAYFVTR